MTLGRAFKSVMDMQSGVPTVELLFRIYCTVFAELGVRGLAQLSHACAEIARAFSFRFKLHQVSSGIEAAPDIRQIMF